METPIHRNPENCTLAELETAMKATPQQRSFVRMQAIRVMLLKFDHDSVARLHNVTRHTINQWIGRFNTAGIDGLIEKPRSSCPRKIDPEQTQSLKELLDQPDKEEISKLRFSSYCSWVCKPGIESHG